MTQLTQMPKDAAKDANIRSALRKMCSEEKVKDVSNLLLVPQKYQKKSESIVTQRGL